MYEILNLGSSSHETEKVDYRKQDKVPFHTEIAGDSTSDLPDFIDKTMENWFSDRRKSYDFNYDYSVGVFDVAAYILKKLGQMTTMKLQKLVYYCQAWSLVWDEKPLFKENIEAWASGPVVRELFNYHRGQFMISTVLIGNPEILSNKQKETIDSVLNYYGNKSSQWLSDLTHMEDPWKLTRAGVPEMQRSHRVIGLDTLAEYYGSLPPEN